MNKLVLSNGAVLEATNLPHHGGACVWVNDHDGNGPLIVAADRARAAMYLLGFDDKQDFDLEVIVGRLWEASLEISPQTFREVIRATLAKFEKRTPVLPSTNPPAPSQGDK